MTSVQVVANNWGSLSHRVIAEAVQKNITDPKQKLLAQKGMPLIRDLFDARYADNPHRSMRNVMRSYPCLTSKAIDAIMTELNPPSNRVIDNRKADSFSILAYPSHRPADLINNPPVYDACSGAPMSWMNELSSSGWTWRNSQQQYEPTAERDKSASCFGAPVTAVPVTRLRDLLTSILGDEGTNFPYLYARVYQAMAEPEITQLDFTRTVALDIAHYMDVNCSNANRKPGDAVAVADELWAIKLR